MLNDRPSFGFVNFRDHEAANVAVDELHDKEWKGKKLFVGRAQKRAERDDELRKVHEERRQENEAKSVGINLYVKNLDGESSLSVWCCFRLMTSWQTSGTTTGFAASLTSLEPSLAARS